MKRYVVEFANDMKASIPKTAAGNVIIARIDKIVFVYRCGKITALEAVKSIANCFEEE